MNNFFENLNKAKQSVHLNNDRKASIRNEVIRFMNSNPIAKPVNSKVPSFSRFNFFGYFKIHRTILASVIACAVLFLGAGTSFAAQGSQPGGILYPIKVHVNEEVQSALTLNLDKKAEFEINRAETRLAEADELAAAGNLNTQAKAEVESNLSANTARIQQRIQHLEDSGDTQKAADLASQFEASLKAHTSVLSAIINDDRENNNDASSLNKQVVLTINAVGSQRKNLNSKISGDTDKIKLKASAEGKINAAANVIQAVQGFIDLKSKSKGGQVDAASAQLKIAQDLLAGAQDKYTAEQFAESFNFASSAQGAALQAKALIKVETSLPDRVKVDLPKTILEQNDKDNMDNKTNDNNSDPAHLPSGEGSENKLPSLPVNPQF